MNCKTMVLAGILAIGSAAAGGHVVQARMLASTGRPMGAAQSIKRSTFTGYYDSHKDLYLSTDSSSKSESRMMGITFAPSMAKIPRSDTPPIYLTSGRAAPHRVAVFGSEPGEKDYSPLWRELSVHWRAGAKAVLLTSDNQILALAAKRKLSVQSTNVVLNCPIIKVKL